MKAQAVKLVVLLYVTHQVYLSFSLADILHLINAYIMIITGVIVVVMLRYVMLFVSDIH